MADGLGMGRVGRGIGGIVMNAWVYPYLAAGPQRVPPACLPYAVLGLVT